MNTVFAFLQEKIVLAPIVTVPEKFYASPLLKSFLICVTGIIALELVLFYLDNVYLLGVIEPWVRLSIVLNVLIFQAYR